MHPRNKYAEKPPDFGLLAGLYPDFKEYVTYGANQRPRIDWTDFNATRELTRSLLHHDYGISWWIPDGQLCPAVTNRANYIHWIEDLLALAPAPWQASGARQVAGMDIGTGANCIYPLLGASLHGWRFVGTDITSVALEWAKWNVESNPHISALIEVRSAVLDSDTSRDENEPSISAYGVVDPALAPSKHESVVEQVPNGSQFSGKELVMESLGTNPSKVLSDEIERSSECSPGEVPSALTIPSRVCNEPGYYSERPGSAEPGNSTPAEKSLGVLVGVVSEEERFDFCMCNPPFFASMEEAGLNPRTACGGTEAEMVCPGGEEAFVAQIIEDSANLKHVIHWFTTMVGRKATLKGLAAKLWALGAAAVRTTEFVQGRTSRWGLAWSFTPPPKAAKKKNPVSNKRNHSFMLEGLGRGCTAVDVLQGLASQLQALGALCSINLPDFSISGFLPDNCDASAVHNKDVLGKRKRETTDETGSEVVMSSNGAGVDISRSFMAWVFQQAPGSLLVKASLSKSSEHGAVFAELFEQAEHSLKHRFVLRSQK